MLMPVNGRARNFAERLRQNKFTIDAFEVVIVHFTRHFDTCKKSLVRTVEAF
jgi:hypothetical protein